MDFKDNIYQSINSNIIQYQIFHFIQLKIKFNQLNLN